MPYKRFSNIIGFDDAPFPRDYHGNVKVVGAVFANLRFDGVIIGEIEKDGSDSAQKLAKLVAESKFAQHTQLVMLQGVTFAGFNVVDVFHLNGQLGLPVLVVSRNLPDMESIRKALTTRVPEGKKKWALIEKLGPMEPVAKVFVQRVGLSAEQAASVIEHFTVHSQIPEPIRTAHLIAGALTNGQSRGHP
ncbi:MAG: DUF99 family protein [Fidelibacterota bacterium]